MKRATFLAVLLSLCGLVAVLPAQAQTVVNPRTVEFDPSADHSTLTADNQPVVQRYDLQIFLAGASQPVTTASLGKPSPQADGKIRVDFSTLVVGWPLADGTYQARVAAVGPTGNASSDPSNTFALQSCAITLGSASQSVPAGGATGNVTVTTGSACAWTATSNAGWVSLGTTSGSGSGSVGFTVTANTGPTARTATLTIGGATFTITQAAPVTCTYALSATTQTFTEIGGPGTVTVTTGSACAWSASGGASWVTLNTGGGTGTGVVSFNVAANTLTASRSATLTIAGRAFTITQAGVPCSLAISPASQAFTGAGGSGTITVTAATGCGWTATSGASWVAVGTASGGGNGTVSFTVAANTAASARSTTLTIGGQAFAVMQAAASCSYALSAASQAFPPTGGTGTVTLTTLGGCGWTATSNAAWATVGTAAGSGTATLSFTVAANTDAASRTATLTIGGRAFTLTQAGGLCTYALSASSSSTFTQSGGNGSVSVSCGSSCSWTATPDAAWVTITLNNGKGPGTVNYSVGKNSNPTARTATITIGDKAYSVNQAAANRPTAPKKVRLTTFIGG